MTTDLYLNLIKKCLTGFIYHDPDIRGQAFNNVARYNGQDWPLIAHTMVGIRRLNHLELCIRDVISNNIIGDFAECGVWRGGVCIFMQACLKALSHTLRTVWVIDSFSGCPPPNPEVYPRDEYFDLSQHKELSVSLNEVIGNFAAYGLADININTVQGWFKDSLPTAPINELAILRLDGDLYESTIQSLQYLYPKISKGGYLIVDDYFGILQCQDAVNDYRREHNIETPISRVDHSCAYWKVI